MEGQHQIMFRRRREWKAHQWLERKHWWTSWAGLGWFAGILCNRGGWIHVSWLGQTNRILCQGNNVSQRDDQKSWREGNKDQLQQLNKNILKGELLGQERDNLTKWSRRVIQELQRIGGRCMWPELQTRQYRNNDHDIARAIGQDSWHLQGFEVVSDSVFPTDPNQGNCNILRRGPGVRPRRQTAISVQLSWTMKQGHYSAIFVSPYGWMADTVSNLGRQTSVPHYLSWRWWVDNAADCNKLDYKLQICTKLTDFDVV